MKTLQPILTILTIAATAAFSADEHGHKAIPGPKGGKVLETEPLHAEFFVQPDKKVSIAFYDESMKPVAPGEQVVKVIAEARPAKPRSILRKPVMHLFLPPLFQRVTATALSSR